MKSHIVKLSSALVSVVLLGCSPANPHASETKIVDHVHDERKLTVHGPHKVIEADYQTEASSDKLLFPSTSRVPRTDVRGRLYLPDNAKGPLPVIVFLHGNHATCGTPPKDPRDPRIDDSIQYTTTGSCPNGQIEVPSHLGYAYSAQHLASWGYAVISVNANLGITAGNGTASDGGLVYARGALVLKHLQKLREWSKGTISATDKIPVDVSNKFDFTEVGIMGHSRGGEGVRYAYNIYQNAAADSAWKKGLPDLKIKGIFEIAPVDFGAGNTPVKIEARGTAWALLLGGCDRDVSNFMGAGPYARMLQTQDGFPKAIFAVWGANHNYFNTEWQVSDAPNTCYGSQTPLWNTDPVKHPPIPNGGNALKNVKGSLVQQQFAQSLMFAFFQANVGKQIDKSLMDTFDPQYALPKELVDLAPTSREFVRLQDSQLVASPGQKTIQQNPNDIIKAETLDVKVARDKAELENYWEAYEAANKPHQINLNFDVPTSFARKSLLLASDVLTTEQTYTIPFQTSISTDSFWTIDANFARRTTCPDETCEFDSSLTDVDVAVVYEDGSNSRFVQLTEYIKLENFHDTYFSMDYAEPFASDPNSYTLYYTYVPLLYSTARFELTDFGAENQNIKGLRLKFPAGQAVALAVDEIRLVKRPN